MAFVKNQYSKFVVTLKEHKIYCKFKFLSNSCKSGMDLIIVAAYVLPEKSPYFSEEIFGDF